MDRSDLITRLEQALTECADDLAAEIEERYRETKDHPAMKRRYDRDMTPVENARALLRAIKEGAE
ncbi:hypothetical protein J2X45_001013 [Caulobacter sp. BE264]|uniref:hypothetical protein n=1 Tax=Caulobacter sp. BE264 TaxID=2817724 RepID=UPI002858794A|nr:hypothetical protein [Caulobacter sp. BE264]MDR7229932.1 hypothetical protein [Caulobacter sp. BE264]